ncbi:MAG: type II toxin-antitoxin system VapC family toxin [Rhodocyclaceae bacterium]|nr:type II toxin-antitoxin system VapC family toxin [Rhodocyclaceae bacterium]
MLYLDTAVVLTLFIDEPTSRPVEDWLAARRQPLAFSDWGLTECASALALKQRRDGMDVALARRCFATIADFVHESCDLIACAPHHQTEAQRLLSRFDLPLRAGDALHLAISQHADATLVTYDRLLAASAKVLGAKVRNPLARSVKP